MSLPDIFGLVPRQWQQHPSLISPRATPAANPIRAAVVTLPPTMTTTDLSTTRTHNFVIRAVTPTTTPRIGSKTPTPASSSTPFPGWDTTTTTSFLESPTTPPATTVPDQSLTATSAPPTTTPYTTKGFTGTIDWPGTHTPTGDMTTPPTLPPRPTDPPKDKSNTGSLSNGAIIGMVAAAFALLTVLSIWFIRRQSKKGRGLFGHSESKKWADYEKGLHQAHHQPGYSGSSSPTHSYYGGNGYGHSDAYYYQYDNNLHNSNSINRGPQNIHPEMEEDNTRSGKVRTQTLPNDTAVYWPPPPGLSPQGLPSPSPPPSPPFASLAAPPSATADAAAAASALLKRSPTRNPQDHRRQEQLEHLLMLQRQQIRELQELQHQHQRENPLSSMSAPHAPTQQDRRIWQQSDQEQRQQWLQQQQPYLPRGGRDNSGGIVVSGPVGAVRDPQDWGIYDDDGGRGGGGGGSGGRGHSQRVIQGRRGNSGDSKEGEEGGEGGEGEAGEDGQQSLRQYIAQMKADYEEQFRKHQEELDRLRAEQETQLQMLRDQIKE